MTSKIDVFVVGGGPAGLAVAIAAAQRGMRVSVADVARPPIDKACGEGIMPEGVSALRAFGVDFTTVATSSFLGIKFIDAASEASAQFSQGSGLGMRRSTLHSLLAAKAESVGVQLFWGTRVEAIGQGEVLAGKKAIQSRYVVCANGQNATLRQSAGLSAGAVYSRRFGFRNHYAVRPWSRFVEVHWDDCGQLYVTPVGPEEVCLALLTSDPRIRLESALVRFPQVKERLGAQAPIGKSLGGVTTTSKLRAVVHGGILLAGDSSGSADAITGDGLSLAFQQAIAMAEAMETGDLCEYQKRHEEISRVPRNIGRLLLIMSDYPWVRKRILHGFLHSPQMLETLLAVHTRTSSAIKLGVRDCLSFGRGVLRA
jgi:flavin-dependent dehydrogenase